MKRTTKSFLTTALILFVAGLVLSLGSFLYAAIAGIDVYGIEKGSKTVETADISLSTIMENSPESDFSRKLVTQEFTKIDILSFTGKVEICTTTGETHVVLTNANTDNIRLEVIGSTLTLAEKNDVGFMGIYIGEKGFSFKGLRQIFGPGNTANTKKTMTLFLNNETIPEEISIRSSIGDVLVEKVQAGQINLHSFYGTATFDRVVADKVQAEKTLGNLVLNDNVCTSFNASVRMGSLEAQQPRDEASSLVIDIWMGSCRINTSDALGLYKLNLSTNFGSITKNNEKCEKALQTSGAGASRISVATLFGSITLDDGGQPAIVPPAEPLETQTGEEPSTGEPQEGEAV